MRHGSLFSGIGGFDLAAEWMGWENVFHCDNNKFCQRILKYYWPNAKSYEDIKQTDFTEWKGKIDIITGGFPCQPYSQAGKRKGKADDRHLWPEMLRAIREIQPRWVVGENVYGLINWKRGMVLYEIKADLEVEGFEVFPPVILPACSKDARHKRYRVFIIAYNNNSGCNWSCEKIIANKRKLNAQHEYYSSITTDINIERMAGLMQEPIQKFWQGTGRQTKQQFTDSFQRSDIFEPKLCRTLYGIPNGVDRIKAIGNAVVWQIAHEIFKAIEQFEGNVFD